jgi:hypothetical protein
VFGANGSPYQQRGEWQFSIASRNLRSNDHYNGTVEQVERQTLQNYVNNTQHLVDLSVSHAVTNRFTVALGVPFVNSTWALRDPAFPLPAERREIPQNGRGIGDISVTGRAWVFNPDTHLDWNVAAGLGLKTPTGNSRYQDVFIGRTDRVEQLRYVDQSVQPGDGGWGLMMEAHAFWRVKGAFLFASGSYLANPKDTNGTPSIISVLEIPLTGQWEGLGVNSVPDQYLARAGGTVPVWEGFSASLAWRMEGLKRYDLFGDSHGWRRPGTSMFIEPGVNYSKGAHSLSFNLPIGYYYNRHPNPYTGNPGDATFPRHIFLTSYSVRFGRAAGAPSTARRPPMVEQPRGVAPHPPNAPAESEVEIATVAAAAPGARVLSPAACPPGYVRSVAGIH